MSLVGATPRQCPKQRAGQTSRQLTSVKCTLWAPECCAGSTSCRYPACRVQRTNYLSTNLCRSLAARRCSANCLNFFKHGNFTSRMPGILGKPVSKMELGGPLPGPSPSRNVVTRAQRTNPALADPKATPRDIHARTLAPLYTSFRQDP